ncbi:multidrug resistance protein Atm1 [Rickettsia rhipicephali str. 3-7-female6-CWPP]|uniref:Multidrug resistance protein Atm1 n=1 Tax=Rickettsia rhipicephali (strain 3-7-female6-CWPP) TaxID=1105113 RepID=A0AAI8A942_RICR3|nr:multidrug resistance protein Atm1 [Rickettsia rhipicephali str. 3-7-female6-CWPP]
MLLFHEIATLHTVALNDDLVFTRAMPARNDAENYNQNVQKQNSQKFILSTSAVFMVEGF